MVWNGLDLYPLLDTWEITPNHKVLVFSLRAQKMGPQRARTPFLSWNLERPGHGHLLFCLSHLAHLWARHKGSRVSRFLAKVWTRSSMGLGAPAGMRFDRHTDGPGGTRRVQMEVVFAFMFLFVYQSPWKSMTLIFGIFFWRNS